MTGLVTDTIQIRAIVLAAKPTDAHKGQYRSNKTNDTCLITTDAHKGQYRSNKTNDTCLITTDAHKGLPYYTMLLCASHDRIVG